MIRIIIADDEVAVLDLEQKLISSFGEDYQIVDRATNGTDALIKVKEKNPDVLLADIRMPGLNGIQLVEQVKQYNPGISTIIVSGYSDFEYVQKVLRLGAEDYLLKPINKNELLECFERLSNRTNDVLLREKKIESISDELEANRQDLYSRVMYDIVFNGTARGANDNPLSFSSVEGPFIALVIKVDIVSSSGGTASDESLTQVITEKYSRYFRQKNIEVRYFCKGYNGYLLIRPDGGISRLRKECDDLGKLIWNSKYMYGLFDLTLGVGTECNGFSSVTETMRCAIKAVRMRLDFGAGKVIYYDDVPERFVQPEPLFPEPEQRSFEKILSRNDPDERNNYIHSAFKTVSRNGKWRLYDYSLEVYQFAADYYTRTEGAEISVLSAGEIREKMENETSPMLLESSLRNSLRGLSEQYMEWQSSQISRPITLIREYIDLHYMENITLEDLANHVYLSPAYISSIFKKETGENFNSYLTDVRLSKARELFKTSNATVAEAAEAVGYKDVRYFSALFYKTYGIKPKDYKKFVHR